MTTSDDEDVYSDSNKKSNMSHVQQMAKKFELMCQNSQQTVCSVSTTTTSSTQRRTWRHQQHPPVVKLDIDQTTNDSPTMDCDENDNNNNEQNDKIIAVSGSDPYESNSPEIKSPSVHLTKRTSRVQWLALQFEQIANINETYHSNDIIIGSHTVEPKISDRYHTSDHDSDDGGDNNEDYRNGHLIYQDHDHDHDHDNDQNTFDNNHEILNAEIIETVVEEIIIDEYNENDQLEINIIDEIIKPNGFYQSNDVDDNFDEEAEENIISDQNNHEQINETNHLQYQPETEAKAEIEEESDESEVEYDNFTDDSEFDSEDNGDGNDINVEETTNNIAISRHQSTLSASTSQVSHIIQELLTTEESYINTLTKGIENYVSIYEKKEMPHTLHGQKYHIFGNIIRIRDFHEQTFYPSLMECENDINLIAKTFCTFIRGDSFYSYISYAINRKRSEGLCLINKKYFQDRQVEVFDRLGINSFLVQPIQRLPKYQLLLNQLLKELLMKQKSDSWLKETVAICCRAEKDVQRLLNRVNTSMSINDICDCYEIKILHQGKFKFLNVFDVYDQDLKRGYRGNIFFFEKCILYTEILEKNKFQYRGYYSNTNIDIEFEEGKNKFILYQNKRGHKEIECSADFNTIQFWTESLEQMKNQSLEDRKKEKSNNRDSGIMNDVPTQPQLVIVRKPFGDIGPMDGRDSNTSSSGSSAWTSGISANSTLSTESESRRTTWYTSVDANLVRNGKTLDRLLNTEKHFIQIFSNYDKMYLRNISQQIAPELSTYILVVKNILNYHKSIHYPNLKNCRHNIIEICHVFKTALRSDEFTMAYQKYAGYSQRAYRTIDHIYLNNNTNNNNNNNTTANNTNELPNASMISLANEWKVYNIPIEHLNRCSTFLEHLMIELKEADDSYVSDEFKAVASTIVMINKFNEIVVDNLNVNAVKIDQKNFINEYGLVKYSEPVSIAGYKNRILLFEQGLVCVRTRISTKTNREKFIQIEFDIPLSAVRTALSTRNSGRIKFFANYAKDCVFKVDFSSKNQKESFLTRLFF